MFDVKLNMLNQPSPGNLIKINNILVIEHYILNLPLDIAGWSSGSPEKRKSLICMFFEDARKSKQAKLADFRHSLGS